MPLTPGTRLGAYEILGPLGAGGMGEVYRAVDTKLKREVAVKVLPPEMAGDSERRIRFQREAEVLASLNHPNIAQIYGIEQNALIMELVDGQTLRGPLPVDTVVDYARQIAEGLEAAHEKGVVHRDLKPGNIMVTPAGVIKILDFGLAAVAPRPASNDPENSPTLTMGASVAGMIMGTAAYMSPEQAAGKQVDKRSDVWSYGVVLYELLTGKRLFEGESISHTLADVLRAPIALDAVPGRLRKLLGRCLDRNAKTRLQDIGEARIALGQLDEPEVAKSAPSKLPWFVAAGAVVAAVGLGVFALRQPAAEERFFQFQMPPPEGAQVQNIALSPDGKWLVLAARKSGKSQLWLRDLNSLTYQAIAGTEDATYPFWSPDGKQIGFFAGGKLKKILASGGPAVALADAIDGRGGTWNQQNEIVFAPSQNDKLYRVPAGGGAPVALASITGPHNHRFPVFLPDGKRVLSYMRGPDAETTGIFISDLGGSPPKRILPDPSSAAWQPIPGEPGMGYVLFRRERTLMGQRFRESDLTPDSDPIPITDDIATSNLSRILATPGPGGMLIFQDGAAEAKPALAWFGRNGKRLGTLGQPSDRESIALSPDGRTVAVQEMREQQFSIRLVDAERGTETRLTSSLGFRPVWWPSGKEVIFTPQRTENGGLVSATLAGTGEPEPLVASKASLSASDVSRDGKYLLYWESDSKSRHDLWFLSDPKNRSGQNQPKVFLKTPFKENQGKFSPDTKWVAYTSDESGKDEVYIRSFPDGNQVKRASVDGGQRALWRGDGQELFYTTPDSDVMAVSIRSVGGELRLGAPEKLFRFAARTGFSSAQSAGYNYAVTGDGRRFLVVESQEKTANPPLTVITNWMPTTKR